jgi:ABC-type Zn uptake system ZnuABC Zn-binding protein ZnuA
MRWLSIFVVALALVLAGCGGSDEESSASDETTVEETLTEETTEDATEETTEDAGTGTDFDFADEDCQALIGVGASIAAAFSGAVDSGSQEDLDELASKVPDEIKADVETLAQALATYSAEIEKIGIAPGATPSAAQLQELQTAIASLDQEELTAASENLEAWSQENCTG